MGRCSQSIKATLPDVRTSFMIGSVVAVDELVHLASGIPRRRRALVLGTPRRATASSGRCAAHRPAAARRPGDHASGTKSAKTSFALLVALEPDAICTQYAGGSETHRRRAIRGRRARSAGRLRDSADDSKSPGRKGRTATRRRFMNIKTMLGAILAATLHRRLATGLRRGRRDQGLVARRPIGTASRGQHRRGGRYAEQDARGRGKRQARQDRAQRNEREGLRRRCARSSEGVRRRQGTRHLRARARVDRRLRAGRIRVEPGRPHQEEPGALRRHHPDAVAGGDLQGRTLRRARRTRKFACSS